MPVAFDAHASGTAAPGTSITYDHTCTGSDLGLVAFGFSATGNDLTGITYNGTSMTLGDSVIWGARYIWAYKLSNPSTGPNSVVASFNDNQWYACATESFTGVDQTDLEDASGTQTGTGSIMVSATTVTDNAWLASAASNNNVGPLNAGSGTTRRGTALSIAYGDSNGAKTPAGSHSMGWDKADPQTGDSSACMLAIKPAAAAVEEAQLRPARHYWW